MKYNAIKDHQCESCGYRTVADVTEKSFSTLVVTCRECGFEDVVDRFEHVLKEIEFAMGSIQTHSSAEYVVGMVTALRMLDPANEEVRELEELAHRESVRKFNEELTKKRKQIEDIAAKCDRLLHREVE